MHSIVIIISFLFLWRRESLEMVLVQVECTCIWPRNRKPIDEYLFLVSSTLISLSSASPEAPVMSECRSHSRHLLLLYVHFIRTNLELRRHFPFFLSVFCAESPDASKQRAGTIRETLKGTKGQSGRKLRWEILQHGMPLRVCAPYFEWVCCEQNDETLYCFIWNYQIHVYLAHTFYVNGDLSDEEDNRGSYFYKHVQ